MIWLTQAVIARLVSVDRRMPDPIRGDRTYRTGLATLVSTLLPIMVGGFTRGSGSGYGCADRWPLCENGLLGCWLPRPEYHMIVEWTHRWLAAIVGVLAVITAVSAWRRHRDNRTVPLSATTAVAVVAFQAWIGRAVVRADLDADLVSLHLAISLTAVGVMAMTVVGARWDRVRDDAQDRQWVFLVGASAVAVFVVIMLGSLVHNLYFPGSPLMFDTLVPDLSSQTAAIHFLHRVASGLYALVAWAIWASARNRGRPHHEVVLLGTAAIVYAVNIAVGAAHVFTLVGSPLLVALHLGLASTVWVMTVATATAVGRVAAGDEAVADSSV